MDCISFVYDYQLNIREISELGQGMRFSCFSSPLLGLGLDATLPIKSALFSMIQKPRDTSIYAILHTSIHFYAPLYTSIFNIVLSICSILLIFCLCGRFTASPNSELADWNSEKNQVVSLRGMWWFFTFRLSPATFAGRAAATLTDGLGRPFHVQ